MKIDYQKLAKAIVDEQERRERMKQTFEVTLQAEALKDFCTKCRRNQEFCRCKPDRSFAFAPDKVQAYKSNWIEIVEKCGCFTCDGKCDEPIYKSEKYNTEVRVHDHATYKCKTCDNRIPITAKLLDWNICSKCYFTALIESERSDVRKYPSAFSKW